MFSIVGKSQEDTDTLSWCGFTLMVNRPLWILLLRKYTLKLCIEQYCRFGFLYLRKKISRGVFFCGTQQIQLLLRSSRTLENALLKWRFYYVCYAIPIIISHYRVATHIGILLFSTCFLGDTRVAIFLNNNYLVGVSRYCIHHLGTQLHLVRKKIRVPLNKIYPQRFR